MRKQTLFNILLIITTMMAIISFITIIYFFQQNANETAFLNKVEQMENDTRRIADRITLELEEGERQLRLLTEIDEIRSGSAEACNERIDNLATFVDDTFDFIARTDANGIFDCSIDSSLVGSSITRLKNNVAASPDGSDPEPVFDVFSLQEGGKLSLGVVIPLLNDAGQVNGSLMTGLNVDEIGTELVEVNTRETSIEFLLLDQAGNILHSDQVVDQNIPYKESGLTSQEVLLIDNIYARLESDSRGTVDQPQKVASFASGNNGDSFQWLTVLMQPKSEMLQAAYSQSGFLGGPEAILALGMIILLVGLAVLFLIMLYSNRIFFKPIKDISRALQRASAGDMKVRIPIGQYARNDEFYTLGEGFNKMVKSISESKERLERLVAERTKDLRSAKNELETAKSELEEKVEELERLNNLMIGREMRMIELKDRIERLRKQQNE